MQPVITCFEIDESERSFMDPKLPEGTKHYYPNAVSVELAAQHPDTTHLVVFVYSQVTKEVLDALPNLQAVFTMSTGYDHIDLETCKERDITVHSVPFYGENTVAEHTFALILAISRRIYESIQRTEGLNFNPDGLVGFDLQEKTLGIIGMGHIGAHVARIAKGFGMNILAYDPFPKEGLDSEIGFEYVSLDHLLEHSDIVSLHTAYRPETHHLINCENIQKFKRGSYLINTARGGLVETQAIVDGLEHGILAGAGLDVLEEECVIKEDKQILTRQYQQSCDLTTVLQNHMLIKDPRVVVTPHNAFNSQEALQRIMETTVQNITQQLQGELENQVK